MYSMLAPNGWTCRKVEMIPEVEQIGHADMLIKLSKCKRHSLSHTVAPDFQFLSPVKHDLKPQQNIQEISLYCSLSSFLTEKQVRMHRVALLRHPSQLRGSCILWLQIRVSVWWRFDAVIFHQSCVLLKPSTSSTNPSALDSLIGPGER